MNPKLKKEIMKWYYEKGLTPYLIAKELKINPIIVKSTIEKELRQDFDSLFN